MKKTIKNYVGVTKVTATLNSEEGQEGDDDIIFGGSKSDLRRIEDIERNISVLANKVVTVSDTSNYESGVDDNFGSIFDDKTRFKDEVRFSSGDIRFDNNTTIQFRGDVTFYNNTVDGVKTTPIYMRRTKSLLTIV